MPYWDQASKNTIRLCKNVPNINGDTPLHYAVFKENTELCKHLLDSGCVKDVTGSAGSQPLVPALFAYGIACSSSGSQTVSKTPERSHIRQLRRARTIRHGPGRASGRATWCGDGPGRPRPTRGKYTRRPGGRVVCTGTGNPGSNVFPASREGHVITSTWLQ